MPATRFKGYTVFGSAVAMSVLTAIGTSAFYVNQASRFADDVDVEGTLSGAVIQADGGNTTLDSNGYRGGTVEADTLSGATIRTTDGDTVIDDASGIVSQDSFSGSTIYTATGIILRDDDGLGCTQLTVRDGAGAFETITCP